MNLSELYSDLSFSGSFSGADKFYREVKKIHPTVTRKLIKEYLKSNNAYTSHKRTTKPSQFRKTYAAHVNHTWQIDLLDFQKYKTHNNNYRYLLCMIDVLSRVLRVKPLHNKTGKAVVKAMSLLLLNHRPKKIHGDEGSEFFNSSFKRMLEAFGSELYHTHSKIKAAIVERVQRTLRLRIARAMTHNKNKDWITIIDRIVENYNNSKHRTLKMTPNEAAENEAKAYKMLYPPIKYRKQMQFSVGDVVKLQRHRKRFEKEAESGWSTDKFIIKARLGTTPTTYTLKTENNNQLIKGSFYSEQLQNVI